jgi:hypothetical protein
MTSPSLFMSIFDLMPGVSDGLFSENYGMNFRSGFGDDILNYILRMSEQERGRTGNPPASKETVKKLPEI